MRAEMERNVISKTRIFSSFQCKYFDWKRGNEDAYIGIQQSAVTKYSNRLLYNMEWSFIQCRTDYCWSDVVLLTGAGGR